LRELKRAKTLAGKREEGAEGKGILSSRLGGKKPSKRRGKKREKRTGSSPSREGLIIKKRRGKHLIAPQQKKERRREGKGIHARQGRGTEEEVIYPRCKSKTALRTLIRKRGKKPLPATERTFRSESKKREFWARTRSDP